MEKKNFNSYDRSRLISGSSFEVSRSFYIVSDLEKEIETTLNSNYDKELNNLKEEEKRLFKELKEKARTWEDLAYKIKVLEETKKYIKLCEYVKNLKTTNNKYIEDVKTYTRNGETISNKVYNLYFSVYKNTHYRNGEEKLLNYDISYNFSINSFTYYNDEEVRKSSNSLMSIKNKKVLTLEEVNKYIEGRKKYFSKYFKEESPVIPIASINNFSHKGKLIEGFRVGKE